jgi:2-iminoacetate synthase ThiH
MSQPFSLDLDGLTSIIEKTRKPNPEDVEAVLSGVGERVLTYQDVATLVSIMFTDRFERAKQIVLEKAKSVRKEKYGNSVVSMAPVEISNRCASDCSFCGWRSDNKAMKRISIDNDIALIQIEYLANKGIGHIELVGGDDINLVKRQLPEIIPRAKAIVERTEKGVISFCTMALTETQYSNLRSCGADSMIMWQETYDETLYNQCIQKGPKANGIDENFKVPEIGDGYRFRLESQDRAARAGLGVSVGAMLGLNPNLAFEVLATISHARHLTDRYTLPHPLIVGMPTWNKITTPETDNRPSEHVDIEPYFTYLAALYLLALSDRDVWVFPNCRVSLQTQINAVEYAGVFTSTEVKLGPAGYMGNVLKSLPEEASEKARTHIYHLIKSNSASTELQKVLDDAEQFQHHYHDHEVYKCEMASRGLELN